MALRPSPVPKAWWLLNQARGWDDFVEAMRLIEPVEVDFNDQVLRVDGGSWLHTGSNEHEATAAGCRATARPRHDL